MPDLILEMLTEINLDFSTLRQGYSRNAITPQQIVNEVYDRIENGGGDCIWTWVRPREEALDQARCLDKLSLEEFPLFGLPFSVKDNIHVAGVPTTAGCPAYSHIPDFTATVVKRAIDAGAIFIGKNTMDQFATGLVGIRSTAGCKNLFDPRYIPGGSSSGSAAAVATNLVSFAFGSDTGGSGRVPAALSNIVGLKPTVGLISTKGMLYCNRSLDCVPVFALSCEDAWDVLMAVYGYDDADPYSKVFDLPVPRFPQNGFSFGLPEAKYLNFFGDSASESAFQHALTHLKAIGGMPVEIDFSPFMEAAAVMSSAPMFVERYLHYGSFIETKFDDINPVTREVILKAKDCSAVDLYLCQQRVQMLRRMAHNELQRCDVMVVPTVGTIYRIDEVMRDPFALNRNMGYYTYFVNPLKLCALAVPAGFRSDGLPHGVCFVGQPGCDALLNAIGRRFHIGPKCGRKHQVDLAESRAHADG